MRALILHILFGCGTFGVGLAIDGASHLLIRTYNSKIESTEAFRAFEAAESNQLRSYDPCEQTLQVVKSGMHFREIPLEVIQRCLKSDQARSNPSIDAKTARRWLRP